MKTGILLTNIGSPAAPTPQAVRRYLKKFLTDKRVVEIPRFFWWPILYGIILPFRSRTSAKLYERIWLEQGAPLTIYSQQLALQLATKIKCPVEIGMHYGEPSIAAALDKLTAQAEKIIVLPLYPQYAASTTAASYEAVINYFQYKRHVPALDFKSDYATHSAYIDSICKKITEYLKTATPDHIVFSFHGLPQRFCDQGDPYANRCFATIEKISQQLQLSKDYYSVTFQSRLGRAQWLKPYTYDVFSQLPKNGKKHIAIVCPGFAVDCLETLEEINMRGREHFVASGGKQFDYIPALNHSETHVDLLQELIFSA